MSTLHITRHVFLAAIFLFSLLLHGCGGGGGKVQSGSLFDPAAKYQGSSAQAVISADNAEALAMGGLAGEGFGVTMSSIGRGKAAAPVTVKGLPALPLAQDLKTLARHLDIAKHAAQLRPQTATGARAKAIRNNSFVVNGPGGGTASYSLQLNDETGNFYGSVSCSGFTSSTTVIDGTCEVLGTFDLNLQEITQISLSFSSLSVTAGGNAYTLAGSASWTFSYPSSNEDLNMNLVVRDGSSSKTYWYSDYHVDTAYGSDRATQTISGRYYDHDHGYVDIVTPTPLVVAYNSQWPFEGAVRMSSAGGRWVSLTFHPTTYGIEAETNGDGVVDWQVERPGNTAPPINMAPSADAGPDASAVAETEVQLNGSASSDPNGDILSYYWSFDSFPSGTGYPGLTGYNTATPSFVPQKPGTYQLRLRVYDGYYSAEDTVTVTVTAAVQAQPSALQQTWQFGNYGSYIGQAGLYTTDLDGDGTPEVIAAASAGGFGSNVLWYVVKKKGSGGFEQVWRSEDYGVSIARILLADMNGDGKEDVVVALTDGSIRYYDGPTLKEFARHTLAPGLRDLAVTDLEGDGKKELVTTDGSSLRVYGAASGDLKWSKSSFGGTSLAVGNIDGGPEKEIVTTSYGGKGYVLSGTAGAGKWEYVNGFGAQVKLADLDGDGMDEIVGASAWYKITIFDGDIRSPAWEIATDQDIDAVLVADADGDGTPEILYGDRQGGTIHAVDTTTHAQKWSMSNNYYAGVSGMAYADVDLDGKKELVWGGGGSTTWADHLFVADPATKVIKWQSLDSAGLSPLAVGDLDNDGVDRLLMITESSNSGYDGGVIQVFDPQSHDLLAQQNLGLSDWMGENRAVRIADVNGDGRSEFVLTTSNTYDGFIRIYDGQSRTVLGQTAAYSGNYFSTLAVGDVDGDGKMEIVAGQGRAHSGAPGVYLMVFDGTTFGQKWKSIDLGSHVYDVKLADLDGDGRMDIIASTYNRLIVYDGSTHVLKLMAESPARALEVADVDGDGVQEILVGRDDGKIDVYNGVSFAIERTVSTYSTSAVDALKVADLDGSGTGKWLVASGGILTVLDGQGLYWRSGYLGASLGRSNSIAVKDTDRDRRPNIFIGSATVLYQFKSMGAPR
ncbi:FG-GAP-like repeat-containing protein [Geomonas sp. RF6]|uniref:FG-GAP-like repeat-containing protein n=1 Tax=Geomonas sp. RF6 TaxID=2897342 RepID=UPI001E341B17|nr:FG-GAP-like repeat-containing protein [Geomonas sp. RF6]UFS72262.1 FG-GAP-like repeat-containing protein [Geomonas sp. RF6]